MAKVKFFRTEGNAAIKEDNVMEQVSEVQAEIAQPATAETAATPQVVEEQPAKGKVQAVFDCVVNGFKKVGTVGGKVLTVVGAGTVIYLGGKAISHLSNKKDASNESIQNDQDRSDEYDDPELRSLIEMEQKEEEKTE